MCASTLASAGIEREGVFVCSFGESSRFRGQNLHVMKCICQHFQSQKLCHTLLDRDERSIRNACSAFAYKICECTARDAVLEPFTSDYCVVILLMLFPVNSVNQRFPSEPAVMLSGKKLLLAGGSEYSVTVPVGVTVPI